MISAFPNMQSRRGGGSSVQDATIRDFSGGLRRVDNQVGMKSSYAPVLNNIVRDSEKSAKIRYGYKEVATASDNIVEIIRFGGSLLLFLEDGTIEKVNPDYSTTPIWNTAIAAALPGTPDAWAAGVTHIDTAGFKSDLIVVNGVDKPLIIDKDLNVNYLQDPATGSNIYTPIAKYITVIGDFVVMAGGADTLTLYFSSKNTAGVWQGDADPNNATSYVLSSQPGSSAEITAIAGFRNFLVVFFLDSIVVMNVGTFDAAGNHTPSVHDSYSDIGSVNHKTLFTTNNDLVFASNKGVFTAARNLFSGSIEASPVSEALGIEFLNEMSSLDVSSSENFVVRDESELRVFFFFKLLDGSQRVYILSHSASFSNLHWASASNLPMTTGCHTQRKRTFFASGDKVYQYGNRVFDGEDYYADNITAANPEGEEIPFDWEFPWLDANKRITTKQLVAVTMDTLGTSEFTLQAFVDKFFKDLEGNYDPALEMKFVAGQSRGYGATNNKGYGGGRAANDERFYGMKSRFKLIKFRIFGSTKEPLTITSLSLVYRMGGLKR